MPGVTFGMNDLSLAMWTPHSAPELRCKRESEWDYASFCSITHYGVTLITKL